MGAGGRRHRPLSQPPAPDHEGFVGGWLLDDDIQLVAYDAAANLESSRYDPINGMEPVYVGPGLQLREDGHIYIRLAPNPHDLTDAQGNVMAPVPVDPDPNHNRLAIFFAGTLFQLTAPVTCSSKM